MSFLELVASDEFLEDGDGAGGVVVEDVSDAPTDALLVFGELFLPELLLLAFDYDFRIKHWLLTLLSSDLLFGSRYFA